MHDHTHHEDDRRGFRAARRFARHMGEGARFGRGGGEGRGDWFRVGRMLAHGDLKLLALALIEEQPRHGYELIKLIEEKTSGCYSPSPGVVYPTLTFLEEAGYVTAESEGAKKRYSITEEGRGLSRGEPRYRRSGAGAAFGHRQEDGAHAPRARERSGRRPERAAAGGRCARQSPGDRGEAARDRG